MSTINDSLRKANTLQRLLLKVQAQQGAWNKDTVSIVEVEATLDEINGYKSDLVIVYKDISDQCTADEMKPHDVNFNVLFNLGRILHIAVGELLTTKKADLKAKKSPSFKLERITLPKFSGTVSEWQSFRDLFKTSVDSNPTLSGGEKLIHLKSCLSGDAAAIISSFQVTDSNYKQAWDLVVKRYSNKRELIFAHIRKLDELKSMQEESAQAIRVVTDNINECVRSLKSLQVPVDEWDLILIYLALKKLSKETRKQWLLDEKATLPALDKFVEYLEVRARALADSEKPSRSKGFPPSQASSKNKSSSHVANSSQVCIKCNESHHLYKCKAFLDSSVAERKELVTSKSLCFNCLFPGHSVAQCQMNFVCRKCGKKHHTLLHMDWNGARSTAASVSSNVPAAQNEEPQSVISSHCSPQENSTNLVLMGTLLVEAEGASGIKQKCRVFVDPGSESNFITENCVDRLGLKRKKTCVNVTGISGSTAETSTGIVSVKLFSQVRDFQITIKSLILKKITGKLPRAQCRSEWSHLQGLQLSDPSFHSPGHIDILLGAEDAGSIMLPGVRHGPSGTPTAQNTQCGWMLSGSVQQQRSLNHYVKVFSNHARCKYDETCLDASLTRFWEIEDQSSSEVSPSQEDEACEKHFQKTCHRDLNGSYTVELPFKEEAPCLGQSRQIALKRFHRVEGRLSQNPDVKKDYVKCMRESIYSNFMELVPQEEVGKSEQVYYMPHREVVKESSSSTKVRIVYDASAKSSSGVSLNDVLMTGPKLQVDLVLLLIRFRSHRVAMSADIVKFYPQFRVNRKHVDYQRLLWREDTSLPVQDFRMLRVTFGVTSAPFLAIRCLQQLAEDENLQFPRAAEIIRNDFLVDNLLSGGDNVESALLIQEEILQVMRRGNLNLSKWSSNYNEIVQAVPESQRDIGVPLFIDDTEGIKTIGLLWNQSTDSFGVSVNIPDPAKSITKRNILSTIAKTFDPLGWLSPVTIRAKILMQELWKNKVEWDSQVPNHIYKSWVKYCQDLTSLKSFRINRCIVIPQPSTQLTEYELHGFSDASQSAYSACIYLKSIRGGFNFVNLIISKTKVAPVKTETIPRLELCGAALLSKLIKTVRESLNMDFRSICCWTDSTIVLDWLSSSGKLPIFIANRVRIIKSNHLITHWSHVSGDENPADPASRGISTQVFLDSQMWLQGPSWLQNAEVKFKPCNTGTLTTPYQKEESSVSLLIKKISSHQKLLRIVAYCLRFIRNTQPSLVGLHGNLSSDEIHQALRRIISSVQAECFQEEIRRCQVGLLIKSKLKQLTPFLDEFGILRVGGRLSNTKMMPDQKHPILLPQKHQFTESLVQYLHVQHLHAGPQLLLALTRDQFWIIRGIDVVKRIVRRCVKCFQQNPATVGQIMGQLPSSRVCQSKPFSKTGLDYAGPFILCAVRGRKPTLTKQYVSVFVCMATKAIHLELVGDLSTPSFIGALHRFISRRGLPSDIYCDGGKNFVGAKNEMIEFLKFMKSNPHQVSVHEFLTTRGINYHLNPPLSPHHGGLWEAGVKSMKNHLKRVLNDHHLTIEEFSTLLCQVEACLNSRPLTQMSADPNDFSVLTPGHFLMGDSPLALPQHDLTDVTTNRLTRWQLVQQMFQHFWRRWNTEYLQSLQSLPKWFNPQPNLDVGVLVLLRDDDPTWGHLKWKLGRISAVYPGPDGKVRVCDVKTAAGPTYKRPIVKLSPLPIY